MSDTEVTEEAEGHVSEDETTEFDYVDEEPASVSSDEDEEDETQERKKRSRKHVDGTLDSVNRKPGYKHEVYARTLLRAPPLPAPIQKQFIRRIARIKRPVSRTTVRALLHASVSAVKKRRNHKPTILEKWMNAEPEWKHENEMRICSGSDRGYYWLEAAYMLANPHLALDCRVASDVLLVFRWMLQRWFQYTKHEKTKNGKGRSVPTKIILRSILTVASQYATTNAYYQDARTIRVFAEKFVLLKLPDRQHEKRQFITNAFSFHNRLLNDGMFLKIPEVFLIDWNLDF